MNKPTKCPLCQSNKVKEIRYGYFGRPTWRTIIYNYFFNPPKDYILGGCCVEEDSPSWYCDKCESRWGKVNLLR